MIVDYLKWMLVVVYSGCVTTDVVVTYKPPIHDQATDLKIEIRMK